jgi:rfaE bifunctional protein kinase chain/domain
MHVKEILERIRNKRALVVGDICLDRWCIYDPGIAEPSRETGIPRVGVLACEVTPGAGGTVANNLIAMGVEQVAVLGILGDDGFAWELQRALEAGRIDARWMVTAPSTQTFTYTKYLNTLTGAEDLPRTDFVNLHPWKSETEQQVLHNLREAVRESDVILVSDQAETEVGGVVGAAMRDELAALAKQYPEKLFWVDSRMRPELFRRVIVKINEDEAEAACHRALGVRDLERLRFDIEAPLLLVTYGGDGVELVEESGRVRVTTKRIEEPVDICGAGDSFSAGAAMALAVTRDAVAAARFGNSVASVTIMKKGTGTASPEEILRAAGQAIS